MASLELLKDNRYRLNQSTVEKPLNSMSYSVKNDGLSARSRKSLSTINYPKKELVKNKDTGTGYSVSKIVVGKQHSHKRVQYLPRYSMAKLPYDRIYNDLMLTNPHESPLGKGVVNTGLKHSFGLGQRKTIVQLKNPVSSIKLARSKPKHHSLASGSLSHVNEYREALQQRADVIEAAVKEEFEQFENMENIEKLVEKRAKRQAKRDKEEEHMYYTRGLMARKSGLALLKHQ